MATIVSNEMITGKVKKIQKRMGISSDNEMARFLHLDDGYYNMVMNGKRNVGLKYIRAIIRYLPELQLDVLEYLRRS